MTERKRVPSTFILPCYEEFLKAVVRVARRVSNEHRYPADDLMTLSASLVAGAVP